MWQKLNFRPYITPVTLAYTMELVITVATSNKYVRRSLLYLQGHAIYRPGANNTKRAEGLKSHLVKIYLPSRPNILHNFHSVINPLIVFISIYKAKDEVKEVCVIYPTFAMVSFAKEWVLYQNMCLMHDVWLSCVMLEVWCLTISIRNSVLNMTRNVNFLQANILLIHVNFQVKAKIPKNSFFFLLFWKSVRSVMFDQTWCLYSLPFIFQGICRKMSYSETRHLSTHLIYRNNERLWIWNFSFIETISPPFCENWSYIIQGQLSGTILTNLCPTCFAVYQWDPWSDIWIIPVLPQFPSICDKKMILLHPFEWLLNASALA